MLNVPSSQKEGGTMWYISTIGTGENHKIQIETANHWDLFEELQKEHRKKHT